MIKKYVLGFVIVAAIWSCKKNATQITLRERAKVSMSTDTTRLTSVTLEAKNNPGKLTADIRCTIQNNLIIALIPAVQNDKKLVATFTTNRAGAVIKVNDTVQVSGKTVTDFTNRVTYSLVLTDGTNKNYTFVVQNFNGIPVIYLTTSAPVVSKNDYVTGSIVVNSNDWYAQPKTYIPLKIKGRGNSTWIRFPKKPYRLKFNDKAAMLGMPSAKNWVLLANYSDKTLIRNAVAFDLGRKIGADFTPLGRFVDVIMNGDYIGNYFLTSQVEIDPNRVNITELDSTDANPADITGGYLLELDRRKDEEVWFETKGGTPFDVHSPDPISAAQLSYISAYMQKFEDVLASSNFADPVNGYAKYINTDSFINWYLIQELTANADAANNTSIYCYKDRNGKLSMGPLWDFDLSCGNINYNVAGYATGWYIRTYSPTYNRLFQDPAFKAKVKTRWNYLKNNYLLNEGKYIDTITHVINLSQQQNFKRWDILNTYVWPNPVVLGTYSNEVAYLKKWLLTRGKWLDVQFSAM